MQTKTIFIEADSKDLSAQFPTVHDPSVIREAEVVPSAPQAGDESDDQRSSNLQGSK